MEKKIAFICITAAVSVLIAFYGLSRKPNAAPDAGNTIPKRIISLDKSMTETLCMLGLKHRIVGIGGYSHDIEEVKGKTIVGRGFGDINIETVISLKPDLIFCWRGHDSDILKDRGFRLFVIRPFNLNEIIETLERVGRITGCSEKANAIAQTMRKRRDTVLEKISKAPNRPSVFFEDRKPLTTRSTGSLAHDLIILAGGKNIAEGLSGSFPRVDNEFVITTNPEIIILEDDGAQEKEIEKRPGWKNISAIKNKRVHVLKSWYTHYSPLCIDGLEAFAQWIHPELFNRKK